MISCEPEEVPLNLLLGCTDSEASNYNSFATEELLPP